MKPFLISDKDWKKLTQKFNKLNIDIWNNLDGLKKINLLKSSKIKFNNVPIFGQDFNLKYPRDLYLYDPNQRFIKLDPTTLNKIRKMAIYEDNEIGGTIEYNNHDQIYDLNYNIGRKTNHDQIYDLNYNKDKIDIYFSGDKTRISLDFESDTHTLFHTHPKDIDRKFDPPSVLDIISYLALIVKNIADIIIHLDNGIEHPIDDPLIVQNSMVFTHDELYIYYISQPLIESITNKLMDLYMATDNFKESAEHLLEELELTYSGYLSKYNFDLDEKQLAQYLSTLSKLGIIVKRYEYIDSPEVYVIF